MASEPICECHIPGCLCRVHDVRPAVARQDQGAEIESALGQVTDGPQVQSRDQGTDDGEQWGVKSDAEVEAQYQRDLAEIAAAEGRPVLLPAPAADPRRAFRDDMVAGVEEARLRDAIANHLRALGPAVRTADEIAASVLRVPELRAALGRQEP